MDYQIEAVKLDGSERGMEDLLLEAKIAIAEMLDAKRQAGGQFRMTFEWLDEGDLTK